MKQSEVIQGMKTSPRSSSTLQWRALVQTGLPFLLGASIVLILQSPQFERSMSSFPTVVSLLGLISAFINPLYFAFAFIGAVSLSYLYQVLFKPLDIFRPHHFQKSAVQRAQALQLPFPKQYANGWFRLFDTSSLAPGQVEQIKVFEQQLVVFRTMTGKAVVLDAYCPHLGANLAVEGTVVGETVRCPFHGWQFDETGRCTHIPYTDREIPESAKVRAWHSREFNGSVYVWHHAEGAPPSWEMPVISPTLFGGPIVYHGRSIHHIEAHHQEIPENGADVAHLGILHCSLIFEWLGKFLSLEHTWSATWDKGGPETPWMTNIKLSQGVSWRGKVIPSSVIPVTINQIGPGCVHLQFDTPFGRCYVIEGVTPLKIMLQQCSHIVFAERRVPRWFAKFILRGLVIQFERDIAIWNNKTYVAKPLLVHGDGKINQFRRWYSQFYSYPTDSVTGMPQKQVEW